MLKLDLVYGNCAYCGRRRYCLRADDAGFLRVQLVCSLCLAVAYRWELETLANARGAIV